MFTLCSILLHTYYAQNNAGIISWFLSTPLKFGSRTFLSLYFHDRKFCPDISLTNEVVPLQSHKIGHVYLYMTPFENSVTFVVILSISSIPSHAEN